MIAWMKNLWASFTNFNKQIGYPPGWTAGVSRDESPDGKLGRDKPDTDDLRDPD